MKYRKSELFIEHILIEHMLIYILNYLKWKNLKKKKMYENKAKLEQELEKINGNIFVQSNVMHE